jgi:hypothetical protein
VLAIVVVLGLVGVLAGVVWEWVWNPPTGVVFRDRWVLSTSRTLSTTGAVQRV